MLRSDDHLLSNRIEVLKVKRAELLRAADSLEQQLRRERRRYDREAELQRLKVPLKRNSGADPKRDRLRREAFRQGYIVGLLSSLLLGLLVVFGRR